MSEIKEYDRETCQTAAELRADGIAIPENIPDCAWIPRGSMRVVGYPHVTCDVPNHMIVDGLSIVFAVPFQWVEVTYSIGDGGAPS